jgi:TonB family protein
MLYDSLPQKEILHLRRPDIFVVLTGNDTVKIYLKNSDSIALSRIDFDALPFNMKKELSANNDGIFTEEQTESEFPGGQYAWMDYLNRSFRYPAQAVRFHMEGTVVVQFIVDEKGKVSNVTAVAGPIGSLREEAIRVIQMSGRWLPATWNGYKVKSYKKQPITFRLTQ